MSQISIFDGAERLKITKPIRLIECFAGYGSQALALKYLGVPFEHWRIAEWAVKSIQAYKDMHFPDDDTDYSAGKDTEWLINYLYASGISADYNKPMTAAQIKRMGENKIRTVYNNIIATHNLCSVCNVHGNDLNITDTDKYTYILTYSFPCFTADTLVLTNKGYKRIADICVGDYVLTHTNTYQRVAATFDNGSHDIWLIKGMCVDEIKATGNHKFYVREKRKQGQRRTFGAPLWKQVRDITNDDYMGVAINQESKLPEWNGVEHIWSDGRKPRKSNILSGMFHTEDFWYVIGRYLADGWIRSQGGVVICAGQDKKRELERRVQNLFGYSMVNERTVCKIHIPLKELGAFVEQFGKGASNKRLTGAIFDLPRDLLSAFLDGYLSGDGCRTGGVVKATSTSRELIYGVAQCVAKAYHTPYAIYHTKRNPTCVIEGRTVNQHDTFELVFKTEKRKQDKAFYEDGFVWYPINTISQIGIERVYDIEVENDHSFTAQNTIVHNCQDLSSAGLGKGMAKGSGTRSGLLWEIERILDECTELPQILLMENVPEVIGTKNFGAFTDWHAKLESLGYKSKWQIINGTEQEMPQNRRRCFMVSWRGDYYYEFPKPKRLELKMSDLLETEVDEKYYLSADILKYFVARSAEQEAKGNGFRFEPTDGDRIAKAVTTRAGGRMDDNFIKE